MKKWALCFVIADCGGDTVYVEQRCESSEECPPGATCTNGWCVLPPTDIDITVVVEPAESESEAEGEPAESESEAEAEAESEAESESESEGEESCTTIPTPEGEEVGVSGAPRFSLHAASPSGVAIPGAQTPVLDVVLTADAVCEGFTVRRLHFRVNYTMNDPVFSSWSPSWLHLSHIRDDGTMTWSTLGLRQNDGSYLYEFIIFRAEMIVDSGDVDQLHLELDTEGASSVADDTVHVSLVGPVDFLPFGGDGTAYEMDVLVEGGTLVF